MNCKWLALALSGLMVFSLGACGDEKEQQSEKTAEEIAVEAAEYQDSTGVYTYATSLVQVPMGANGDVLCYVTMPGNYLLYGVVGDGSQISNTLSTLLEEDAFGTREENLLKTVELYGVSGDIGTTAFTLYTSGEEGYLSMSDAESVCDTAIGTLDLPAFADYENMVVYIGITNDATLAVSYKNGELLENMEVNTLATCLFNLVSVPEAEAE